MATTKGTFHVDGWDESPYVEGEGKKMSLAIVRQTFSGDIKGSGEARWLMAYRADGTAHFVGLQRVEGEVDGRRGSFVLDTTGDFDGTMARWSATVLEGCGGGALGSVAGSGHFAAPHGSVATYELELD